MENLNILDTFSEAYARKIDALYRDYDVLHKACRYALEGAGKRVRPQLCMLSCLSAGGDPLAALNAAIAIEMVHTYSLVHDDLPLMDNDDWRRHRLTTHKVFGDVVALLAGDAILTDAFSVLTSNNEELTNQLKPKTITALISELAAAAGRNGMVLGQSMDIAWTTRADEANVEQLKRMHLLKTGKIIAASCVMGALCSQQVTSRDLDYYREFGHKLGLAFQIVDDLLDSQQNTGKTKNKDQEQGKLTFVSKLGSELARSLANTLTKECQDLLAMHIKNPDGLANLTQQLLERDH